MFAPGFSSTFPRSERLASPFDLHYFELPYFEPLLLGNKALLNRLVPRPECDPLDAAPAEKLSPEALTKMLHSFLAETQTITRSQIALVDSWEFVDSDARADTMNAIRELVYENTDFAMQLVTQLFRQGSDVMVSSPDVPHPLELREIEYNGYLGRYALTLQEYHKKPLGQPVLLPTPLQPQPAQVKIPFHEDHVQFSLA